MRQIFVTAHIPDPRYNHGRVLDITEWPVEDAERLQEVWAGEVEVVVRVSK